MGMVTNKTDRMQSCIDACNQCAQACFECFNACLNEEDVMARKNCISTLVECAMMCQMSAAIMSMNGKTIKEHCDLCATICKECALHCTMFKEDDHCKKCADICTMCENECKKMGAM